MVLLVVAVFVGAAALDYAAAGYQRAVVAGARHRAACWSVAMCLVASAGYYSVLEVSPLLIIPECLGLYAGTLLAVRTPKPGT